MTRFATKAAARQFSRVLKEADKSPVFIERHKQPRAVVVSIRRFRLYEKLLAHISQEAAIASFEEAIERACEGRVGLANRARKNAAFLSGLEAAERAGKGGK